MYIIWQHIIDLECVIKIMNVIQNYNTKYKIKNKLGIYYELNE